ncbi:MAG: type II and III secretion system protein [Xanthomonadales bacterium]|nr:type II and III secretion system protein [Xanthomonadales bacterium]
MSTKIPMYPATSRCFKIIAVFTMVLLISACAGHEERHNDDDLDQLFESYRAQNAMIVQRRSAAQNRGIERLEFTETDNGSVLVSVDLIEARLDVVVMLILDGTGTDYINENTTLPGTVSARFEAKPLIEALAILLRPRGMTASMSDSMVILGRGSQTTAMDTVLASFPDNAEKIHIDWPLENISTQRALEVLDSIFPIDEDSGLREIDFASHIEANSIILSGTRGNVESAIRLLDNIDEDTGHVLLEALVVEFNVQSFLDMGAQISNGASGEFSNIFVDFANLVGDTVSFTRIADVTNISSFTAVLNMLIRDDNARIVSRPYLSTISGSPAQLEITEDRFVVVQTPGGLDITLEQISSGIVLDILPVVTKNKNILLDISIDQSQFIPTLGNVELRRSRNTVKTSARVSDGQTVIIGGLSLKTRAQSVAGLPGLRDLPGLKYFFGHEDHFDQENQVMIFVTPHRWEPGMDAPLVGKNKWGIYDHSEAKSMSNE